MSPPSKFTFLASLRPLRHHSSTCGICYDRFPTTSTTHSSHAPIQLPCGHVLGKSCLITWTAETAQRNHNKCPQCLTRLFRKESRRPDTSENRRDPQGQGHEQVHSTADELRSTSSYHTARSHPRTSRRAPPPREDSTREQRRQRETRVYAARASTVADSETTLSPRDAAMAEARMAGFADFRGFMPTSADALPPPPEEFAPPPGYFGSGRVHPRPTVVIPPVMLMGSQGDSGRGFQPRRTARTQAEEGRRGAYVDVGGNPNLFTASERPPSPVDEEEEERMMRRRLATWRGE